MPAGVLVGDCVVVVLGNDADVVQDRGDIQQLMIDLADVLDDGERLGPVPGADRVGGDRRRLVLGRQLEGTARGGGVRRDEVSDAHGSMLPEQVASDYVMLADIWPTGRHATEL